MRDGYVAQLDGSIREVTGDPAALRRMKEELVPQAKLANVAGGETGRHATAAEAGWQGAAYASMRARVQGVADEFVDAGNVLAKAAYGFERAAGALEKASGEIGRIKEAFTGATDPMIEQARQVPPAQEATAAKAFTRNIDASGKQATGAAAKVLKAFDDQMWAIASDVGPTKTAQPGRQGNEGYVIYPNGEVRYGGERAWRNNNPGNLEYGPRARRFGAIGADGYRRDPRKSQGPFAIFPDEASGAAAMRDLMRETHKDKTLPEALRTYAPSSENDIPAYVRAVADHSGLDVTTRTIGSYTQDEFDRLIAGMRLHESARPGTVFTRETAPPWLLPRLGP
ncbi:hypothetical protein [Actinophytocola sp.]|uniref:hypothetical protein n=1 Tax=Actinophytocola sp. TaxID=1872138 RepID=UPI002ED02055